MTRLTRFAYLVFVFGATTGAATASTITYSGTGTLSFVSGTDPAGLSGTTWTITSTLTTDQIPISSTALADGGIRDVFAGQAIVTGNLSLSLPDEIALTWYPHPTATEVDTIGLSANGNILGVLPISLASQMKVTLPGATPEAFAQSAIPASARFTVNASTFESATFKLLNGSVQATPTPEPGTLAMLCGGAMLAAGAIFTKRRSVVA